jgi:hypothetical protein
MSLVEDREDGGRDGGAAVAQTGVGQGMGERR